MAEALGVVWIRRKAAGRGLRVSVGTLVNQKSNGLRPATSAVTQAPRGVFFIIMKMNKALRIPLGLELSVNCLHIYGKMGRPWMGFPSFGAEFGHPLQRGFG